MIPEELTDLQLAQVLNGEYQSLRQVEANLRALNQELQRRQEEAQKGDEVNDKDSNGD